MEPFWWSLFGAGGTLAALLMPIHLLLSGLAIPLGLIPAPAYERLATLIALPPTRLYLFALISLSLFHWAHRFRFTLYDGLQLKHLNLLIAILCYGGAALGTLATGYTLWAI